MLFADGLDSPLGWCCLGPVVLVVLVIRTVSSAVQSVAGWFSSDGGVVEEIAKEVATSWLSEWVRGWFE